MSLREKEDFRDQLSRVQMMAEDPGETWDLSDNDQAALKAVLADRQRIAEELSALRAVEQRGPQQDRASGGGSQVDSVCEGE